MHFQNVAVILHFATPEGLSEEQAVSAIKCFLQQQGHCEPLPVGWYIGVPVEAESVAPWVKEYTARYTPPPAPSNTPSFSPHDTANNRGWLD